MTARNFFVGMGMGLLVGGTTALLVKPKKKSVKKSVGKTIRAMGEVADSVSSAMGW